VSYNKKSGKYVFFAERLRYQPLARVGCLRVS